MSYDLVSDVPFEEELSDYIRNGFVVSTPTMIMLFRLCNLAEEGRPEEVAWYIRFAYGNLYQLIDALPCYLPKICFSRYHAGRRLDKKLRIYNFYRLRKIALARRKEGRQHYG
jgi:hypothetical protein